jgi:hypothetical protein
LITQLIAIENDEEGNYSSYNIMSKRRSIE